MATLLELQHNMQAGLIARDVTAIARSFDDGIGPDRLDIYRNTILSALTRALRLAYPVVERLVGSKFFEGAADVFIAGHLPRTAYLDQYGDEFSDFLSGFAPAASLPYLADVARLEWAINCALHANDVGPFDLQALAAVISDKAADFRLKPHPSMRLVRVEYPADVIWRAILANDDGALASIDLDSGPFFLLIERRPSGIEVIRLEEGCWQFVNRIFAGETVQEALGSCPDIDMTYVLAEQFALGRFVAFDLAPHSGS